MEKITTKLPGTKVLLVDDYFINQELAKDLLELMECEVDIAEDGVEAVDMFCESDYDLIIMDVQMPNKDGIQATKEIREIEAKNGKYTPIIALTANALCDDEQRCLKAGMDGYVAKPLDPNRLEETMKKLLSKGAAT